MNCNEKPLSILTLPDLCLLQIFYYLPLRDLLKLHKVCFHFRNLQPSAFARIRYLTLIVNYHCINETMHDLDYLLFENRFYSFPYRQNVLNKQIYYPSLHYSANCSNKVSYRQQSQQQYKNRLCLSELCKKQVDFITKRFFNLTHLRLAIIIDFPVTDTNELVSFLQFYSNKLISFNLQCYYRNAFFYWEEIDDNDGDYVNLVELNNLMEDAQVRQQHLFFVHETIEEHDKKLQISKQLFRIVAVVNKMSSLRYLTLDFSNYFISCSLATNFKISLPIIASLKEFFFHSFDNPKFLLDSLIMYGESNGQLEKLGIANDVFRKHDRDYCSRWPNSLSNELGAKFTLIPPIHYPLNQKLIQTFTSLTSVTLKQSRGSVISLSLYYIARSLSCLKQLIHLKIFYDNSQPPLYLDDDRIAKNVRKKISPLEISAKVLEIFFSGKSHRDFYSKYWGLIFPELGVLKIHLTGAWSCKLCGYEHYLSLSTSKQKKCLRKLAQPLWPQWLSSHNYNQKEFQIFAFLSESLEYWPVDRPQANKKKRREERKLSRTLMKLLFIS